MDTANNSAAPELRGDAVAELYSGKTSRYFSGVSWGLVEAVPIGEHKVLEIGCGAGRTGAKLRELGKAREVVGIDLNPAAVVAAADRLDNAICANIEDADLPYPLEYFDYVLCGDVLEHLHDPWSALKRIRRYLKNDHFLIASIPNVRNWRVLRDLVLFGRWDYCDAGILDHTHLRFFTERSIVEMFSGAGFSIDALSHGPFPRKERLANVLTLGFGKGFLVKQYLVKSRKMGQHSKGERP